MLFYAQLLNVPLCVPTKTYIEGVTVKTSCFLFVCLFVCLFVLVTYIYLDRRSVFFDIFDLRVACQYIYMSVEVTGLGKTKNAHTMP